jgi:hypothetical protein
VGRDGVEPSTSSLSEKRSTDELTAQVFYNVILSETKNLGFRLLGSEILHSVQDDITVPRVILLSPTHQVGLFLYPAVLLVPK